jgi:hypothetical protein
MNVFVFSSLSLSLTCAFVGILRRDQLRQYLSWTTDLTSARDQIRDRQFRFEQNSRRELWISARQISAGLTLSIVLFAVAIFVLLWTLNPFVALAVFLFTAVALRVIFEGDISHYYLVLSSWVRVLKSKLSLSSPSTWLESFRDVDEYEIGLKPAKGEDFALLSRAIVSKPSGLATSNVTDSGKWANHIAAMLGLCELSAYTDNTKESAKDSESRWGPLTRGDGKGMAIGQILRVVFRMLEDRSPSRDPLRLPPWIPQSAVSGLKCPWLEWMDPALHNLSAGEISCFSDIIATQLPRFLELRVITKADNSPNEALLCGLWLAHALYLIVPHGPDLKLHQAAVLAAIRLQFTNLWANASMTTQKFDEQRADGPEFLRWKVDEWQDSVNRMLDIGRARMDRLFLDSSHQNNGESQV